MGVFAALQFLPVSAAQDKVRIQGRPAAVGLKIEDQGFSGLGLESEEIRFGVGADHSGEGRRQGNEERVGPVGVGLGVGQFDEIAQLKN